MARISKYIKGDTSTSDAPSIDTSWGIQNAGPYIGIVKQNFDEFKSGRLKVLIPSITGDYNAKEDNLIECRYLSPFYGNKGLTYVTAGNKYADSQFSYGFWAVPPDLETRVLVIFAEGKTENAFWIGCVQEPITNHMTPGLASDSNVVDEQGKSANQEYGSTNIPAGEINRLKKDVTYYNYEEKPHPIHPFADTLLKQGLIGDNIRGTTTSSAQRESPSQVFGMSTPGRKNYGSVTRNTGPKESNEEDIVDRLSGHTFVMDDGAADGSNQLTRLRTASGHQLLMHDTAGVVYIANGSGNAYIEMTKDGRIDVYSGVGGINLRTEGDFNLHSDSNINFHANGQIRMKAETELVQSSDMTMNISKSGTFTTSTNGSVMTFGSQGISSYTGGQQLHGAAGGTHLAGGQIHFNSCSPSNSWGPHWLNNGSVSMVTREEGDVELSQKGIKPLDMFSRQTKTTVHRFVTHEPMFRADIISSDGIIPIDHDDKKQWSRLSNTPGTTEYMNQSNRLSDNQSIRYAQYQADALEYVKQKMGNSTNVTKAKELLTEFGLDYDKIYGINGRMDLPFDIKDSISTKIKGVDILTTAKDSMSSVLSSQVLEKFTNKSTELFKDNVFVNSSGQLFAIGKDNIDLASSTLHTVKGLKENLSTGNVSSAISNISNISNTFTNVTGGKIIGINKMSGAITRSIAKFRGLDTMNPNEMANVFKPAGLGKGLMKAVGSIGGIIKGWFS